MEPLLHAHLDCRRLSLDSYNEILAIDGDLQKGAKERNRTTINHSSVPHNPTLTAYRKILVLRIVGHQN